MGKSKEVKTNVMRILDQMKIGYKAYTYECEEFVDAVQIADMLGLSYEKVYKTLVTVGSKGEHFVFVIPIREELDLKKAAKEVGEKALSMIPVKELLKVTGYVRGGCTAIGMKKTYVTRIDKRAESLEWMIVSGGRIGSQMELAPQDLCRACGGAFADVIVG